MGTLGGHLLPGSFFIIFGLWHSFMATVRYVHARHHNKQRSRKQNFFKGSVTYPCIWMPLDALRRAPTESYIKLFFITVGIAGEVITGINFWPEPHPNPYDTAAVKPAMDSGVHHGGSMDSGGGSEHHHTRRDVHSLEKRMVLPVTNWYMVDVNVQHCTMYSMFAIGSVVEILMARGWHFPPKTEYVCGFLAFMVEAFIFAFHLHAREPMDVHLHTLLVYSISACAVCTCLEIYNDRQVLWTYARCLCVILQGTWFYEVGFVLYPPWDTTKITSGFFTRWDLYDHVQVMTITVSYIWHIMLIALSLLVQYCLVEAWVARSKRKMLFSDEIYELVVRENDDDVDGAPRYAMLNDTATSQPKMLAAINSDDDDNSLDEDVEFDTTKLLNRSSSNNSNKNKKAQNGGSSSPPNSSSSSGHGSAHSNSLV